MWNREIADEQKQKELMEFLHHVKIIDVKQIDVIGYSVSVQTASGYTLNWKTAGVGKGVIDVDWYHNYGTLYLFTDLIEPFKSRLNVINDIAVKEFLNGSSLSADQYDELIRNSKAVGVSTYRPFIMKGFEMPQPKKNKWGCIGWYLIVCLIVILIVILLWTT